MKFSGIFRALIVAIFAIKLAAAGGGNAGAPNCWFYQQHFNVSLVHYKEKINNWIMHIEDLFTAYVAKNPLKPAAQLNKKLDDILTHSIGMFDLIKRNMLEEVTHLAGSTDDVIERAVHSLFGMPFPVYCFAALADVQTIYDEAREEVRRFEDDLKRY